MNLNKKEQEFIKKYKNYLIFRVEPFSKPEKVSIDNVISIVSNSLGEGTDDVIYLLFEKGYNLNYKIENDKFDYSFSESELIDMFKNTSGDK